MGKMDPQARSLSCDGRLHACRSEEDRTYSAEQATTDCTYLGLLPDIDIPIITAAAIEDRSKGDALSKIIAILQTTWFIVQCIARGQQQLAPTELEPVTLALSSLNRRYLVA